MRRRSFSHKQAHFRKQMYALGAGLLLLLLFLAVFGLNSVIAVSSWIGDKISGRNSALQEQNEEFFGTVFVDDLPPATNSARILVSGSAANFESVQIYLNGTLVKTAKVLSQDLFSETVGSLREGPNTIEIIGISAKHKERKSTKPITVVYKNNKPRLEVSEPQDGATVNSREVTFKGTTDQDVTLEIDGAPVVVTANGSFEKTVRLSEGENKITVLAIDEATNETKQEFTLIYKKEE
ncbi:MAG: hypothetical protein N2691_03345 [Patescibacteria group bacterium]|nr:hypothetical protein [Patescibacteria group bacterium]